MNLHSSVFFRIVKLGIRAYKPTLTHEIPLPSLPHGTAYKTTKVPYIGGYGAVPVMDEDRANRPKIIKNILEWNNALSPITDKSHPWLSREQGEQFVQTTFGDYLPELRVSWNGFDPTGDEALSWWALSGFGSLELRRLSEQAAQAESTGEHIPFLVSSFEFMQDLEVRPGLVSYGGALYLDRDGKPVKIKLRGKDILPNAGRTWEEAKFAYRSSALFWCTLYHHLYFTHYIVSNTGVLATIRQLPVDNPLRHLLKPFLFRSAAINDSGLSSLMPRGSAIHRASGLSWEGMQAAYSMMLKIHTFPCFPDDLKARGTDNNSLQSFSADLFQYGRDGETYWNCLNGFASDVLECAPAFKNITRDEATRRWWEEMNSGFKNSEHDLSEQNLSRFLTQFFFTVTAFHSWVGHVTPYVIDPSVAAGKLFPESIMADQQNSAELGAIASITGLPTPALMGDFTHLMPDAYSRQSLKRLQQNLSVMHEELVRRNASRAIPLRAFYPEELNLSVAI